MTKQLTSIRTMDGADAVHPVAAELPSRALSKGHRMLLRQNDRPLHLSQVDPAFRHDVLKGLSVQPRAIPPRWLYDRRGSELFEEITTLAEYYPTRTERSILCHAASEIAELTGPDRAIVEFGAGSSVKTSILLSEVRPAAYVP